MSNNAEVELKLPVIPDIELSATKTAEVISKHMNLSEEKTGEISMATVPSYEGYMSILEHHIPIITFLKPGIVKIFNRVNRSNRIIIYHPILLNHNNLWSNIFFVQDHNNIF